MVSIIIPNKDGLFYLKTLFKDFSYKTNYSNYEIIVVDNASSDNSVEYLKSLDLNIKIIENEENVSFAKGNNDAIKIANGEYVLLLNNDIEPTYGWLNELMGTIIYNDNVASVGAKLIYPFFYDLQYTNRSFSIQHAGDILRESIDDMCLYKGHNQNKFSRDIFDSEINVNKKRLLVTGAVLLIKKRIYEEVGGLDERYNYGYEDIDFNLTAELEKFAKDMIKSKFEPGNLVGGGFNYIVEIEHLLKDLPDRLNSTLNKLENGELELNMNHTGLDELKDQLSISLIVSALLVGSSIAILADKGPRVWDISAIGFFGFLISAILGIYIIIKFIRTEK